MLGGEDFSRGAAASTRSTQTAKLMTAKKSVIEDFPKTFII
jgi:hypothetical protein